MYEFFAPSRSIVANFRSYWTDADRPMSRADPSEKTIVGTAGCAMRPRRRSPGCPRPKDKPAHRAPARSALPAHAPQACGHILRGRSCIRGASSPRKAPPCHSRVGHCTTSKEVLLCACRAALADGTPARADAIPLRMRAHQLDVRGVAGSLETQPTIRAIVDLVRASLTSVETDLDVVVGPERHAVTQRPCRRRPSRFVVRSARP